MNKYIVFCTVLTCALGVSIAGVSTVHYALLIVGGLISMFIMLFKPIDRKLLNMLCLFGAPFLLSLFVSLPVNYIFNRKFQYFELEVLGRITMMVSTFFTIIYIHYLNTKDPSNFKKFIWLYYVSCSIMLLSAVWQALDVYTSLAINFPIDTRTNVHGSNRVSIGSRITGLAQEPSYLAPFLNEFILLSFLLIKSKIVKIFLLAISLVIILVTFSPSAYTSFLILLFIVIALRVNKVMLFLLIPVILMFISVINFSDIEAFKYYSDRMTGANDSGRVMVLYDAIYMSFNDTNFFRLLFGNGFKSFQIMTTAPEINYYMITSNNLYVDVLFECGIAGVSILLFFIFFILKKIMMMTDRRLMLFSLLMFVNLLLSALYRADFTTLKFLWVVYLVYYIVEMDRKTKSL